MRLSNFRKNDKVLLVGEGNFSFAVSLVKHNLPIAITASCYESSILHFTTRNNVNFLRDHGVRILLGIDATKLLSNPFLSTERFNVIIFNFPHVGGKMRLDKNRELLQKFFISAASSLEIDGTIFMTLCNGQGGTLADEPARRWDDSWKVREMAAHGNFVLARVEKFDTTNFANYRSTGYRSLEKEFNMQNSLTHIFKRIRDPLNLDFAPKIKLHFLELNNGRKEIRYVDILPEKNSYPLCPPIFVFDLTFSISKDFRKFDLFNVLYNFAGKIVRDVEFVRSYEFPDEKVTETYRISYQSNDLPLYRKRIVDIHRYIVAKILEENLNVIVTR